MPNFDIEKQLKKPVIGIDEVGRGPLAGPVVSCACFFSSYKLAPKDLIALNDSKKLSKIKRKSSLKLILLLKKNNQINFALGTASVSEIDKLNILQATLLSMKRAVLKLNLKRGSIIVDGKNKLDIENFFCNNIIKGDQLSTSIATASIIAKVYRDKYMATIDKYYPNFNWKSNSGYGTAEHINQIKKVGISIHHRKSFKPVKKFIHNNN